MLYNKYRPHTLETFVGQEAIKMSVSNMIASGEFPHAQMYIGHSGSGKTTMARIVAMAMNCSNGITKPCGQCSNCQDILARRASDVIEIDAASNNGVDNIRDLKEKANFMPVQLENKIYIIDEFHMMTTQACNALLKLLEEPPPKCYFILCTTEQDKVLTTVQNRCRKYYFGSLTPPEIASSLRSITGAEGFNIDEQALDLISHNTDGGLRDAICKLEESMNASSGDKHITAEIVKRVCKIASKEIVETLYSGVIAGKTEFVLILLERIDKNGYNLQEICLQLIEMWNHRINSHYLGKNVIANPEAHIKSVKTLCDVHPKMNHKLIARSLFDISMIECCDTFKF